MCVLFVVVVFFFCKQKTAYEVRISDWSSDVCSSDLRGLPKSDSRGAVRDADRLLPRWHTPPRCACSARCDRGRARFLWRCHDGLLNRPRPSHGDVATRRCRGDKPQHCMGSEETTSELQSIMRISYAVFCVNNTKTRNMHYLSHYIVD